jgi:hypothetical protein
VIDLLKTIGSPIKITEFANFNNQISLIKINEFTFFKEIIASSQESVTKIHDYLLDFKDITKLKIKQDENLLSISVKMVNSYFQYEEVLPSLENIYENQLNF